MSTRPILDVADELGVAREHVIVCGRDKAKIDPSALADGRAAGAGRLILVSAINPTPGGEGKTTMSIGLAMGMRRLGKKVALCLREPSLGPVFGVKGGGTGGGRASLHPADDINLHFTGDIHAITSANNLLSAMIDNALHFGGTFGDAGRLDARRITWARALDMNDRALRNVVVGLGERTDGVPRQERFDITAASEVMAILALAKDQADLEARLARVVVGATESSRPVTAEDLGASSAMAALLRDAIYPNLVQTNEGGPALVHAGPFANIAHGCSSILATRLASHFSDYVITEAGFGFDLGGEKFLDIKCRALGAWPRMLVLVATLRALKFHGGVPAKETAKPAPAALEAGLEHLEHHVSSARARGLPVVVVLNRFPTDTDEEIASVQRALDRSGVRAVACDAFARGGEGALDLARAVAEEVERTDASPPAPRFTYELDDPLPTKIEKVAKAFYGADGVVLTNKAQKDIERIGARGASLPVCMAKTQLSLTDDPERQGRPKGFTVTVREARLAAGAGFVVALTGDLMTMPGLPKEPAAKNVRVDAGGRIRGLMQGD
ncbi:MAG: formate--tetrahydrofolate ligase [Polyangiaceae bacterium]|jgi:formate--tetrahydrofolate ligase|nr:formate--tetrahydrofolate ligase [Polyangiaceae bacterium]MBK8941409.1 formate--tetrahydrofolate ligase [Polyangiaceae bacterium]